MTIGGVALAFTIAIGANLVSPTAHRILVGGLQRATGLGARHHTVSHPTGAEGAEPAGDAEPVTTSPSTTTSGVPLPPLASTFLYDLADTDDFQPNADVRVAPADIDGTAYPRSLVYTCDLFCNDGPKGLVSVNLDRRYRSFHATIGPLATASRSAAPIFEVFLDGARKSGPTQVPFGSHQEVNVDITGALRLELVITDGVGAAESPALRGAELVGGGGGALPASAWGDAIVVP